MKTYRTKSQNGVENIEFVGSAAYKGKAEGHLTFDYGNDSYTVSGEFWCDPAGVLHHTFVAQGEEIEICVPLD